MIGAALVQFQLNSTDPAERAVALSAIERDADPSHLAALRGATGTETDPALKQRKERLERLLTIQFDTDDAARIAAIQSFSGDLGVDLRAALNPLVATRVRWQRPCRKVQCCLRLEPIPCPAKAPMTF